MRLAELDERALLADPALQTRRGRPDDVHGPLLRGRPPLGSDCGVRLLLSGARRPFHPQRLDAAMDVLLDGVVRTRGRIWLATRPEGVLWLESAGDGLQLGHAGHWLAAGRRHRVGGSPRRAQGTGRTGLGSAVRRPRPGPRGDHAHADPDEIDAALRGALLTDAELSGGEDAWSRLPDPFGWEDAGAGGASAVSDSPGDRVARAARGLHTTEQEES